MSVCGCVCLCKCVCVVLHLYVSPSPGAHDRKEVLEVARNADCELSTVSPLLNPTSFESTKASLPLFFTQPEITQLQRTCTLEALFYSMCTHMRAYPQTQNLLFEKSSFYVKLRRNVFWRNGEQGHCVLFLIYKFISWSYLQTEKCVYNMQTNS